MSNKSKLKESYEAEAKFGAFYTGGNVEWQGNHLFCQNTTSIAKVDIETGTVTQHISEDKSLDPDTIQTFTCHSDTLVTAHKSGLLKLWNSDYIVEKVWKYIHKGPIASLSLQGSILLSGGSDGIVRVWNLEHQACILALKGCQGVVNVLRQIQDKVLASGDDGKVLQWTSSGQLTISYEGHFSKVTCLQENYNGKHFVTAGRDKVIILWEFGNSQALKTIPVYEGIEYLICLPEVFSVPNYKGTGGIHVATGGEKGVVRVWNVLESKEVYAQASESSLVSAAKQEGGLAITKLLIDESKEKLGIVSAEQNIILINCKSFVTIKQLVGFSDEILDIVFCKKDTKVAIATNSPDIKLYDSTTMDCQLLKGHQDIVMSLNCAPFNEDILASASKDNTIRIWSLDSLPKCLYVGSGHSGSVITCAFFNSVPKLITGSHDTCVKVWNLPKKDQKDLQCLNTQIAHSKDINMIAVSPNDKLIASCSQDKTIKLWSEDLVLVGVMKGHKRGVWCVRFSPVDQILITSSADCTVKLWSVAEGNCLKTIQRHESSILRVEFLSAGLQILTAGADGLLKIFDVKTGESSVNLEEVHEARIWAVAIKKDESGILTGGSDSTLVRWKNTTEEKRAEALKQLEETALEEQKLSNYINDGNLLKALRLALKLEKPFTVLKIIRGVLKDDQQISHLTSTIGSLRDDQKEALLKCAGEWNTNSRNSQVAQVVLNILIREMHEGRFRPIGLGNILETFLPYTERHLKRTTDMLQDLQFINYTINCMQPHAKT